MVELFLTLLLLLTNADKGTTSQDASSSAKMNTTSSTPEENPNSGESEGEGEGETGYDGGSGNWDTKD